MSIPDPGGDILNPGAAEKMAEKVVERRYLFQPKDEVLPPGANAGDQDEIFAFNYPPMPAVMSLKVKIDPKPLADAIDHFIQTSNLKQLVKACQSAKIEVVSSPDSPIVTLRLIP